MRNRALWIVLVCFVAAGPAAEAEFRYGFVQPGWLDTDVGGASGDGPALTASVPVHRFVHVVGSWADQDFEGVFDLETVEIGAGGHRTLGERIDLFGQLTWVDMTVDAGMAGTGSEQGYRATVGVRTRAATRLELDAAINRIDVSGVSEDDSLSLAVLVDVSRRIALVGAASFGDFDHVAVGARVHFGRR